MEFVATEQSVSGIADFTQTLLAAGRGDAQASECLPLLVYDQLRQLARARLAALPAHQTLSATELVHEAYLRLVGDVKVEWGDRRAFFAAAATVMRDILVESCRKRSRLKRGGNLRRISLQEADELAAGGELDYLALDTALTRLGDEDPNKREIVMLRYFAGLTIEETAATLGSSPATVKRHWLYAKAWLLDAMTNEMN